MRDIFVAVDGSPASRAALEFAVEEAKLRGAPLTAVHVYKAEPPEDDSARYRRGQDVLGPAGPLGPDVEASRHTDEVTRRAAIRRRDEEHQHARAWIEAAEQRARAVVEDLLEQVGMGTTEDVTPLVIQDAHPARALVEATVGAQLLVIGMRRRSAVGKLVLGSVVQNVLLGAECPVVAIKADTEPAED